MVQKIGSIRSLRTRGEWVSGTDYLPGDAVEFGNGIYVANDAVTGATAPADDTAHWELLWLIVPAGGTSGQVLAKSSDADGDYAWTTP